MTTYHNSLYWVRSLLFLCFLGLSSAATVTAAEQEEEAAVAARLDSFHQAASDADADAYFGAFAKDGVFLGTDASERWSVEAFKEYAQPYFSKGKGWTYVPRDRSIAIHEDVAWFDELLDNESYGECRGSGVLVKEGNEWKIAQYNLHFPVPNNLAKQVTQMIKDSASPD